MKVACVLQVRDGHTEMMLLAFSKEQDVSVERLHDLLHFLHVCIGRQNDLDARIFQIIILHKFLIRQRADDHSLRQHAQSQFRVLAHLQHLGQRELPSRDAAAFLFWLLVRVLVVVLSADTAVVLAVDSELVETVAKVTLDSHDWDGMGEKKQKKIAAGFIDPAHWQTGLYTCLTIPVFLVANRL